MKLFYLRDRFSYIFLVTILPLTGCQTKLTVARPSLENIDYILVEKAEKTITVFNHEEELAKYHVALGRSPIGHKEKEGDLKTPEGIYSIIHKNPDSRYYKAMTISYPNKQDKENAEKKGFDPGGEIQIHGYQQDLSWASQDHLLDSATRGCILLTNPEMEQIFAATKIGTTIEIKP